MKTIWAAGSWADATRNVPHPARHSHVLRAFRSRRRHIRPAHGALCSTLRILRTPRRPPSLAHRVLSCQLPARCFPRGVHGGNGDLHLSQSETQLIHIPGLLQSLLQSGVARRAALVVVVALCSLELRRCPVEQREPDTQVRICLTARCAFLTLLAILTALHQRPDMADCGEPHRTNPQAGQALEGEHL
jgi:hypothetical protein